MKIPQHLMSECNIQAEFYRQCVVANLNCTLELNTPVGRLDAVLFSYDWQRVLAIVECKKGQFNQYSRQIFRYRSIGVPIHGLNKMEECESLVRMIKNAGDTGKLWVDVCDMERIKRGKRKFNPLLDVDEMINFKS